MFWIIRWIREFVMETFFWSVLVYWEGMQIRHFAWSEADAMQWFECYGFDADVALFHGNDMVRCRIAIY